MKLFLKIIVGIVVVFIVVSAAGLFYITRGLDNKASLEVASIEPASVKDGTYLGEYSGGRWSNQLEITVKDGKIVNIIIVKDVLFPKPDWTKELFDAVIEQQNTTVDVVSGATVTSKAYLKSIENSMNQK